MQGKEMTRRSTVLASIWVAVAILLRVYGAQGGDASIVSGLLFLIWTAPFGVIWQFWIYDFSLRWMQPATAQLLGDVLVIAVGAAFWFVLMPAIGRRARPEPGK